MLVDAVANIILDRILGDSAGPVGATAFIGLMTTAPAANGSGVVEPVGFAYSRVGVTNNATQWPAAVARIKQHANDIVFPAASGGSWGTITHVGVFDAISGGNLRLFDALGTPRLISDTDVFRFLAGGANALKFSA